MYKLGLALDCYKENELITIEKKPKSRFSTLQIKKYSYAKNSLSPFSITINVN